MRPWISTDLPLPVAPATRVCGSCCCAPPKAEPRLRYRDLSIQFAQADHERRVQTRRVAIQFAPRPHVPQGHRLALRPRHRDDDLAWQGRDRDEAKAMRRQEGRLLAFDVLHPKPSEPMNRISAALGVKTGPRIFACNP